MIGARDTSGSESEAVAAGGRDVEGRNGEPAGERHSAPAAPVSAETPTDVVRDEEPSRTGHVSEVPQPDVQDGREQQPVELFGFDVRLIGTVLVSGFAAWLLLRVVGLPEWANIVAVAGMVGVVPAVLAMLVRILLAIGGGHSTRFTRAQLSSFIGRWVPVLWVASTVAAVLVGQSWTGTSASDFLLWLVLGQVSGLAAGLVATLGWHRVEPPAEQAVVFAGEENMPAVQLGGGTNTTDASQRTALSAGDAATISDAARTGSVRSQVRPHRVDGRAADSGETGDRLQSVLVPVAVLLAGGPAAWWTWLAGTGPTGLVLGAGVAWLWLLWSGWCAH